jgi:hypothetical protein
VQLASAIFGKHKKMSKVFASAGSRKISFDVFDIKSISFYGVPNIAVYDMLKPHV